MRVVSRCLTLSFALALGSFSLPANTVTFDDLPSLTDMSTVSPYGGLNWTNYTSYKDSGTNSVTYDGYANGVVSQPGAVFSGGEIAGDTVVEISGSFSSSTPFTLNAAYLGAAHRNGEEVVVNGFNGSNLVFSQTLTLFTSGAQQYSFEEAGLTSVVITPVAGTGVDTYGCGSFNCTQFTMDNLEINDPIPTNAPEPASLLLGGLAFGVLGLLRGRLARGN